MLSPPGRKGHVRKSAGPKPLFLVMQSGVVLSESWPGVWAPAPELLCGSTLKAGGAGASSSWGNGIRESQGWVRWESEAAMTTLQTKGPSERLLWRGLCPRRPGRPRSARAARGWPGVAEGGWAEEEVQRRRKERD